ncbi:MAG: hypothetical protein M0Q12_09025 [Synergistaceae bacterium]|nr:hypothetical protein [Synergistaceae bacterium]
MESKSNVKTASDKEIIEFIEKDPTVTIDELMGRFKCGDHRARRLKKPFAEKLRSIIEKPQENFTEEGNDNQKSLVSVSHSIKTLEDALKAGNVDTGIWEVDRYVINKWEVGAKYRDQNLKWDKGIMDGHSIRKNEWLTQPLWQVKVWLRRKVDKKVSDGLDELLKEAKKHFPKYTKIQTPKPVKDKHLLEISIFDLHFGKLAWGKETGTDYDMKIAEKIYHDAVVELCSKTKGFPIEKILFPVGQDFFHIDNARNTTVNDTPQDVDSRYPKIFAKGVLACVNAIDYLRAIAPVDILWVPGNHDRTSSYHLVRELAAWYKGVNNVIVDVSPSPRKYVHYGRCLIGFTHGDDEKHSMLPTLMADEASEAWADCISKEWHIGHTHTRKRMAYGMDDSYGSVTVRTLPSLSGTDSWHFKKGYVKSTRAAEGYLWSKEKGYSGHFSANI